MKFEPDEVGAEAAKLEKFSDAGGSQIQRLSDAGRFTLFDREQYQMLFFAFLLAMTFSAEIYCDRSKSVKNAEEAAQIFVSRTRGVFRDTARSEEQKYAAKLTPADSHFLGGSSIAATELDIRIPVVDMQDFNAPDRRDHFIDRLSRAMREVGFFAVRNTGVDRNTIRNAYSAAEEFFKQEKETKERSFAKELNGQRGFVPGETAKGTAAKDRKEFYHIGRELGDKERERLQYAPNVWPDQVRFKEDMLTLYSELERYVGFLFEAIVEAINRDSIDKIPKGIFANMTFEGNSLLRALYYPALSQISMNDAVLWAAPHTDIDLLAILPYATEKGLQVEIDGQWLNVVVPEDAFIVNVGDMLENLTNGLFRSARHRVVALEPGKDRFSMVFFVHPTDDASLAPLPSCIAQTGHIQRYAPGTRKEFLWERLLELNIAPLLLEPYSKTGHTERQMQFGRQSPQVVQMLLESGLASQELIDAISKK